MKTTIAMLLFVLITAYSEQCFSEDGPRNGNYWREMDYAGRLNYIVGFFDGMELGKMFSLWELMDEDENIGCNCELEVIESYGKYSDLFMSNITNYQVVDGLNEFYADYKNRSIKIDSGFWVVLNIIAGVPDYKVQELIENLRRSAKLHQK